MSLCASISRTTWIDSSCTCGLLKRESNGVKKLQGLNWKEVWTVMSVLATGVIWLDMDVRDYDVNHLA
jgi:hypothetical protein